MTARVHTVAKHGDCRQLLAAVVAHKVLHIQEHLRGSVHAASSALHLTHVPRVESHSTALCRARTATSHKAMSRTFIFSFTCSKP